MLPSEEGDWTRAPEATLANWSLGTLCKHVPTTYAEGGDVGNPDKVRTLLQVGAYGERLFAFELEATKGDFATKLVVRDSQAGLAACLADDRHSDHLDAHEWGDQLIFKGLDFALGETCVTKYRLVEVSTGDWYLPIFGKLTEESEELLHERVKTAQETNGWTQSGKGGKMHPAVDEASQGKATAEAKTKMLAKFIPKAGKTKLTRPQTSTRSGTPFVNTGNTLAFSGMRLALESDKEPESGAESVTTIKGPRKRKTTDGMLEPGLEKMSKAARLESEAEEELDDGEIKIKTEREEGEDPEDDTQEHQDFYGLEAETEADSKQSAKYAMYKSAKGRSG